MLKHFCFRIKSSQSLKMRYIQRHFSTAINEVCQGFFKRIIDLGLLNVLW